jgi:hypothetical protein
MPNFSCANLTEANFDGHALFPGVIEWRRVVTSKDVTKPAWYTTLTQSLKVETDHGNLVFLPIQVIPPKFFKANLREAHLEKSLFFTFSDNPANYVDGPTNSIRAAEASFTIGGIDNAAFQIGRERASRYPGEQDIKDPESDVLRFQTRMRASFYSASIEHTNMPKQVAEFLKRSEPTIFDYENVYGAPRLLERDHDANCIPRR